MHDDLILSELLFFIALNMSVSKLKRTLRQARTIASNTIFQKKDVLVAIFILYNRA
jgi:hypothetical protein